MLADKLAALHSGARPQKATTVGALAELYMKARAAYWRPKTIEHNHGIWNNYLRDEFGARNPASILPGEIEMYLSKLKAEGVSDCYCNRHMVLLKAILAFGVRNHALREMPEFPDKFSETQYVRQGYCDSADFHFHLIDRIPEDALWLETMVRLAYTFGFRKNELLNLRRRHVDLERHLILLDGANTKNRMPRKIVLNPSGAAHKLLEKCCAGKSPEAYVISRDAKGSIPIRDFRNDWDKISAGIATGSGPGGALFFHDLRRSAIRNMAEMGIMEHDAMVLAGHLSADVHRRYRGLSESYLREISARIDK